MNDSNDQCLQGIMQVTSGQVDYLTSYQIAEATGKQHKHVLRDIRNLIEQGVQQSNFGLMFKVSELANGGERKDPYYRLTQKGCLILASGYNAQLREKIIDRWSQLEQERRNGGFSIPQTYSEALMLAAKQAEQLTMSQRREVLLQSQCKVLAEQNDRAEQELEAAKPARVFAQAVETSRQSILIGELAVILKQNGIDIGQNRLFDWMRKNGYLFRWGDRYNQPTQRSMELQLFEVKKTTITRPNGEVLVTSTTKVTGKGQVYFVNKFLFEAEKHAGKGKKKSARPYGAAPEPGKRKAQEAAKPQDPANVADAVHPKASVGAEPSES